MSQSKMPKTGGKVGQSEKEGQGHREDCDQRGACSAWAEHFVDVSSCIETLMLRFEFANNSILLQL